VIPWRVHEPSGHEAIIVSSVRCMLIALPRALAVTCSEGRFITVGQRMQPACQQTDPHHMVVKQPVTTRMKSIANSQMHGRSLVCCSEADVYYAKPSLCPISTTSTPFTGPLSCGLILPPTDQFKAHRTSAPILTSQAKSRESPKPAWRSGNLQRTSYSLPCSCKR
jgi:hypothetical protein